MNQLVHLHNECRQEACLVSATRQQAHRSLATHPNGLP